MDEPLESEGEEGGIGPDDWRRMRDHVETYLTRFDVHVWPIYQAAGISRDAALVAFMLQGIADKLDDVIDELREDR